MEQNKFTFYPHLGSIPNDWTVVNSGAVCTKVTDGTHDTPTPISTGIPYIKSVHIKKGTITFDNALFLSKEDHDIIYKRCNPEKGDLLIVNIGIGNIGECAYVNAEFEFSMKNIALLKPNPKYLDGKYLYYYYKSIKNKVVHATKTGGAQPFLSIKDLKKLKLVIPPIPEQLKIADILSIWSKAITTTEKLITISKQQKKSLAQQLLMGNKRLINPETNKPFESDWEEVKVNKLLTESRITCTDNNPNNRLTVRLKLKGVEKRVVRGTESINSTSYFTRKSGQFIYGKQNIHKGAFGIINKVLDGFQSSQDLPTFDFTSKCNSVWFYHLMSQENLYSSLESKMTGTGSKRLNPKAFLLTKVALPVKAEQQKIASVLTTADKDIELLEAKLAHFKQEKKALMQQLLTGKRRVKVNKLEVA